MLDPESGIPVKDREYKLKKYNDTFVASEAVEWIMHNFGYTRSEAIEFGQELVYKKKIVHTGLNINQTH